MEESPHGERQDPRESFNARTLGIRVLVGAVLIPLVILINHVGGVAFAIFVALLAGLGSHEFYSMFLKTEANPSRAVGILGSVCVCFAFYLGSGEAGGITLTAFVGVILIERLISQDRERYVSSVGFTLVGIVYSGWLLGYFVLLRNLAEGLPGMSLNGGSQAGRDFVYLVLVLTWSYDTVAYLAGSLLGRHKLLSRISPSKTIEGTASGLAGSVAAALISRATFASYLGLGQAISLGIFLGIVAQIGDLVESMIKRSTGTKDSSRLIPGHGGILDRFDSLLFTGPAFYFYLRLMLLRVRP